MPTLISLSLNYPRMIDSSNKPGEPPHLDASGECVHYRRRCSKDFLWGAFGERVDPYPEENFGSEGTPCQKLNPEKSQRTQLLLL